MDGGDIMNYYTTPPKKNKNEPKKPKFSRLEIILFICFIVILGTVFIIQYIQTHPPEPPCSHEYKLQYSLPESCVADGFNNFMCIHCEERYSEVIEATGHKYNPYVVEPSCERDGRKSERCKCGDERDVEIIKATGHKPKSIQIIAPTCETNGVEQFKCEVCAYTYPCPIEATGHVMSDNKCVNCGYIPEEPPVPKPVEPTPAQPIELIVKLTAYCPCHKCIIDDNHQMVDSNSKPQTDHTIAVDPNIIPIGSIVIINGKEYVAEATGGEIDDNHIDIFFDSHEVACDFGVKEDVKVIVYLYEENNKNE